MQNKMTNYLPDLNNKKHMEKNKNKAINKMFCSRFASSQLFG